MISLETKPSPNLPASPNRNKSARPISIFFDRETAEFFRGKDLEMFELGQSKQNEEWVSYPGGRQVMLDRLKMPYFSADAKLPRLIGVSRDVT